MPNPETDVAKLQRLIRLPAVPQAATWEIVNYGLSNTTDLGPSDWGIIVVLTYDEDTLASLRANPAAVKIKRDLKVAQSFLRDWYPPAIVESFQPDSASENLVLKEPRYEPALFAASPLSDGYFFIKDTFVFVYLHTQ